MGQSSAIFLLLSCLACGRIFASSQAEPLLPCPAELSQASCSPSARDLKEAKQAFRRGLKLEKSDLHEAYLAFKRASELAPRHLDYVTARELLRQQLIAERLERGNQELDSGDQVKALADFREALSLDPANTFAQERLRDVLGEEARKPAAAPVVIAQSPVVRLLPADNLASFHFRGDSRELFQTIARSFGLTAQIDDSVPSRRVRFDIDDVGFFKAMAVADQMLRVFWVPMGEKQALVAADTAENRRQFEPMAMRTFYIPGADTPAAINDFMNLLRNVFDIRFITPNAPSSTLLVRAPEPLLEAATQFLMRLDSDRPQVMLEVSVYQVSHTLTRNLGVHIPDQFHVFNIPVGALQALGGQNIQDLINQLISSGAINQANNTALSALLAQLANQQNSIFSQPLATFGGGKTFSGVSLDRLTGELSVNEGWVKILDHAMLRASAANDATFRMGSRYPILNASFAPIFNTSSISQVIQNNSFQAAFPSVSYEDLGLTIKAKPALTAQNDINLALEISLRALAGGSFNGVPVLGNREYKGSISLLDGEPAIVAGQVTSSETRALAGIPGLGEIPGLNKITATNTKQSEYDELLMVLTPHILSRNARQDSEVYLPK